jgi:RHH-type proline utilization regulon transcriptional repressor/proline dehydrogenase/delta 1-pyrroline-5-carboxylate dehydrogenase
MGFGSFAPVPRTPRESLSLRGLDRGVREVLEASQPGLDFAGFDAARAGALSDQRAWEDEFGAARDDSRVEVLADQPIERNVLRYRPVPVTVRAAEGAAPADLIRVLLAAARSGSRVRVSSAAPLPASLLALLDSGVSSLRATAVDVEPDTVFAARVAAERPARIRVIAPQAVADPHAAGRALLEAVDGDPDVAVWSGAVTASGRVELLPFLREQAVSITAHRFGNPYPALAELPL